jgi:transcription termination/antitermination protein NusG
MNNESKATEEVVTEQNLSEAQEVKEEAATAAVSEGSDVAESVKEEATEVAEPEAEVGEEEAPAINKEEEVAETEKAAWYILQVFTGKESRVKERMESLLEERDWGARVHRILVPEEETIEIKDNKRHEKTSKIYPGYVFVQMEIDQEILYELTRIVGVAKIVGSKTQPTPVNDDEILKVLRKVGDKTKKIDVDFEIDEVIKVISGPFRGYTGGISEINGERGKLKALISIFGRETPVELDFDQVEKAVK